MYGTPVFEEEEEVGGDSSLGSSNSRSRGQTFRKKVPKTSLLHHLLEEEQEDQQTFGSPAFYANDTDRGGGDSGSGVSDCYEAIITPYCTDSAVE